MAAVHSKCYALLSGASASTYNQAELSMLCRSKLPVEVCRMAAGELGPTPWSPSTMGRACGKWEEQWSERAVQMSPEERRLDGEDWQAQIDEITRKKAAVGICTGKAVDECAAHKREEYPKYTKQLNDAMAEKYRSYRDDRSGLGAAGEGAPAEAEAYVCLLCICASQSRKKRSGEMEEDEDTTSDDEAQSPQQASRPRLASRGLAAPDAGALFNRMDANHDGVLSRQEWAAGQAVLRSHGQVQALQMPGAGSAGHPFREPLSARAIRVGPSGA